MSKLSDYLKTKKIDARRLFVASKDIEQLRPADRSLKLLKVQAKAGNEAAKAKVAGAEGKGPPKPRSGRMLTSPTLNAALAGEAVNGPAKTRILRAVNAVLASKKSGEAKLEDLF